MGANMLAGAGPSIQGAGGGADGPPLSMQGTNGATPQASPTPAPGNMFAAPNAHGAPQARPGMPPPPPTPPPLSAVIDALHKVSYIHSTLKVLLNKPDLSTKDVLNEVGDAVANGVMGPFDAATELKSLPASDDSLALRQWVGQHYATSAKNMQTLAEMVEAHGNMVRRGGAPMPASQMSNAFQGG